MKATTNRKALAAAVKSVVVPAGTSRVDVLSGLHIEADAKAGVLTLTSTNLDLTVTLDVEATITEPGVVVVPADRFVRFLAACDSESAAVDQADGVVKVICGDSDVALRTLNAEHWPKSITAEGDSVVLPAEDLHRIARIIYATEQDTKLKAQHPSRWIVHLNGKRAECTDTFRCAVAGLTVDLPEACVPVDVIRRVAESVRATETEAVTVTVDGRQATFATDRQSWTTRLVLVEFPPLDRLLATEPPNVLRLTTSELLDALDRVAVVDGEQRLVTLTPDGGKVIVSNSGKDVGEATSIVPCTGEFDEAIVFMRSYLADLLKAHDEETIEIRLGPTGRHPIMVRSSDSRLAHMTMPTRVGV